MAARGRRRPARLPRQGAGGAGRPPAYRALRPAVRLAGRRLRCRRQRRLRQPQRHRRVLVRPVEAVLAARLSRSRATRTHFVGPTATGAPSPGPSRRCVPLRVEMPSNPKPMRIVRGVEIAAPTGKPAASVRIKLFALGALPGGAPVIAQPSRPGLERRAALAGRDDDVVDEDAETLSAPVAGVGDRDLDRLTRIRAEVDRPLLPTARVAAGRVPRAAGAGGRAGVDAVSVW